MKQQFSWGLLILSIVAVLGAYGWQQAASCSALLPSQPLPVLGTVPEFQLTDPAGRPFHSGALRAQVWIADFIFTSCAGACPQMSDRMSRFQKELPASIHFVSVSVDPARDTPAKLAEYAQRYGADTRRWHFLTGPAAEISSLAQKGFRLSVAEGADPAEPIVHSQRFVLVDRDGRIRGYYLSDDPVQMKRLSRDASSL